MASQDSPPTPSPSGSPLSGYTGTSNVWLFILFRIFFNCRFYYPVFAIMFLDFGLSEEQFAYLNFGWAIAIVVLEVPSGALADQFGRRTLVIAASVLMVIEMTVMCLMPVVHREDYGQSPADLADYQGGLAMLFFVFLINRVVSGAAEAAASGADEALAYDSLDPATRDTVWTRMMAHLMRWQSVGFIFVTLIGAAVYDPELMTSAARLFGYEGALTQRATLKFPIYLNLLMAFIALGIALRMRENFIPEPSRGVWTSVVRSFRRTLTTGGWILRTPAVLILILIGLFYDSIVRLYYTVGSVYLRVLQFDEAYFGLVGVAGAITGIVSAAFVERLAANHTPRFNFSLLTILIFAGLIALAHPLVPYYGAVFLIPFWIAMRFLHFFISYYMNRVTDSAHRATVLSFKGLTMNLAYGAVMVLYAAQTRATTALKEEFQDPATLSHQAKRAQEVEVFTEVIQWWWPYFAVVVLGLYLYRKFAIKDSLNHLLQAR